MSKTMEHFLHFGQICHVPQELPLRGKLITLTVPNATQLHQARVKFKVGSTKNLFDIKFVYGILKIPNFGTYDHTKALFRNLIAFEQCHMHEG